MTDGWTAPAHWKPLFCCQGHWLTNNICAEHEIEPWSTWLHWWLPKLAHTRQLKGQHSCRVRRRSWSAFPNTPPAWFNTFETGKDTYVFSAQCLSRIDAGKHQEDVNKAQLKGVHVPCDLRIPLCIPCDIEMPTASLHTLLVFPLVGMYTNY